MSEQTLAHAPDEVASTMGQPETRRGIALRTLPVAPFALLFYAALSLLMFSSVWFTGNPVLAGGPGDPELGVWFLSWPPEALFHHRNPLYSTYQQYPYGLSMMWNVSAILPAFALFPLTVAVNAQTSFNLLNLLAPIVAGFCMFVLVRRYVKHDIAAIAAGLLYGFNPYMVVHSGGHVFITFLFFPPLALLLLDEILVRRRRSPIQLGFFLGLLTLGQLLTSEEVIMTTLIITIPVVAGIALAHPREAWRALPYVSKALGVALATLLILGSYPLYFQFFGPGRLPSAVHPPGVYVADLLATVVPGPLTHFSTPRSVQLATLFSGNLAENSGYVSIPLLALVILGGVLLWRRKVVRIALCAALLTFVLSLGPTVEIGGQDWHIWMPWNALQNLPLLDNVLPARLMMMFYLSIAIVLGVTVDAAIERRSWALRASTVALAGLSIAALIPALPYPTTRMPVPSFFTSDLVKRIPSGDVVVVAPWTHLPGEMMALVWQAQTHMQFRMPEGYGYWRTPGGTLAVLAPGTRLGDRLVSFEEGQQPALSDDDRSTMLLELRTLKVHTLISGPGPGQAQSTELFTSLTGQEPQHVGGVDVWWDITTSLATQS
jgi:hypothetical protein